MAALVTGIRRGDAGPEFRERLSRNERPRHTGGMIDQSDEIATIRIELRDTDPPIWRQVEVPTSITLNVLHSVVQAAMGWSNSHLWQFTIARQLYGPPMGRDWGPTPMRDAAKVLLREVLRPSRTTIDYLYDFGDSWEHRLVVTRIRQGEPGVGYPRYVAGEGNAPPEDCGGIPGFYDQLAILADPEHPDHAEVAEWFDGYDPKAIDERAITVALGRIDQRRNAPARRRKAAGPG